MGRKSILIAALGLLWVFGVSVQAQPLAQYTFNDGTANDVSGNGFDGVLLGTAAIVTDPERGQVLQINQSGMQADGPFKITTSFTLSAWIKLDVPRTGRYYFGGPWQFRMDEQGGSWAWVEFRYPNGAFVDKFDTRSVDSPDGQLDGQWHHIAIVVTTTRKHTILKVPWDRFSSGQKMRMAEMPLTDTWTTSECSITQSAKRKFRD